MKHHDSHAHDTMTERTRLLRRSCWAWWCLSSTSSSSFPLVISSGTSAFQIESHHTVKRRHITPSVPIPRQPHAESSLDRLHVLEASAHTITQTTGPQLHCTRLFSTRGGAEISTSTEAETDDSMITGRAYLDAISAKALDDDLMRQPGGFSLEQLMELAGLAVAQAVYEVLGSTSTATIDTEASVCDTNESDSKHILVICGPGNNGGDGLVAARHLVHFGYKCEVVYPKRPSAKNPHHQHFENLVEQCLAVGVQIRSEMPELDEAQDEMMYRYDVIVDAIFGFSFVGQPREPFGSILDQIQRWQRSQENTGRVFSVDVPSGWHVDDGDVNESGFMPDVLISLTAPKGCAKQFVAGPGRRHFCGGRFVPLAIAQKYDIALPKYSGSMQITELPFE